MLKLGILDFDTSHCVEFTRRLNHIGDDKEQFVEGAKVVIGCAGESKLAPDRIEGYAKQMKEYGVALVDNPADMIGKVDGMLIEAVDGTVHAARARPFLEAGVPCFIDKPFTCSSADAKRLADLAAKKKVPIFSSSALRYAPELVEYLADPKHGNRAGCVTYGPASLSPLPERNAGLFHYGVHAVEMLYALMGPGCKRVTCTSEKGVDVATGRWSDGRVATVRGTRTPASGFGFTAFAEKGVKAVEVGTKFIYRELLKKVVEAFTTGTAPLDIAETIEIVAFIEAANRSGANHGAGETVKV
jgi:predicted dehydrogenase